MSTEQGPFYVHVEGTPPQYAARRLLFTHGKGPYLFDKQGIKYLDFGAGIAVNALGYGLKKLAKIASSQMKKLIHVSNLYANEPMMHLAEDLLSLPFSSRKFQSLHFGNSGAEANEAALKYARAYAKISKGPDAYEIISFDHSFHGRTMGALSTSSQKKYKEKFEPLLPGCVSIPYNDVAKLKKTVGKNTAAIIVEGVQGEGGLRSMDRAFAEALNDVSKQHNVVLIADEIQTGLGRCGALAASVHLGLDPDIITLAKPLAAGLPISATLLSQKIHAIVELGDHGTTFGGGPVTSAVAREVVQTLSTSAFLRLIEKKAEILDALLMEHFSKPFATELRGLGMLRGIVLDASISGAAVIERAATQGLLVLRSGENVIRIAPPLVIPDALLKKGIAVLARVIEDCRRSPYIGV